MNTDPQPRQCFLPCCGARAWQRLAYVEWGDSDNPDVVVCVHGLTRTGRDFDVLARRLAERYRVVCPDVIGRGLSDWLTDAAEYGYPRYVSDAAQLIARLGVARVHWVGTSMGGILGMLIAAMPGNPVRSLVLNDVGSLVPKAALDVIAAYVGKPPSFDSLAAAGEYLARLHSGFGLDAAQWQVLAPHSARQDSDGRWRLRYDPAIGAAFQGQLQDVDLSAYWTAIQAPTLVLRGADSQLLLSATLQEMLMQRPGTQSLTLAGVGHAPGLQSDEQVRVITDFLLAH